MNELVVCTRLAQPTAFDTYRFTGVVRYPRLIWFVDDLPECSTGKVQGRDIAIHTADHS